MLTLSERLLSAACNELGGRQYGHPSRSDMRAGHRRRMTDCSVAVASILVELYGDDVKREWGALMVGDPSQPFSPVEACMRLGIAEEVATPLPSRWHVVQGWRQLDQQTGWVPDPSPVPNGHTFLYYEPPAMAPGPGVLLNANVSRPWRKFCAWGEAVGPYRAGVELAALKESL